MDYILRKATVDDLKEIVEIEARNFKAPFSYDNYLYELNENKFANIEVIEVDGKIASYIDYWITFDSATVVKIATEFSQKNRGFAGFLLENMEKTLKEKGVEFVTLEVRFSNLPAINLYKKHGYQEVGIKRGYYSNGEDAIGMIKGLI